MPVYRYQTTSGENTIGASVIDAPDRATAVRLLIQRGITPTRVEEEGEGSARAPDRSAGASAGGARAPAFLSGGPVMSRAETAALVHEMAIALGAGLPLIQVLRTVAKQGRSIRQRAMLDTLIGDIERGRPLSEAMESWGRPFSDLLVNLTSAGEISGRLPEVLSQASVLLERDLRMRRAVVAALIYPAIIMTVIAIAIVVLVTVIVPRILEAVGDRVALPWPTRVLNGTAEFVGQWWWLMAVMAALGVWGFARLRATPGPRLAMDRALLRVPVVGTLVRDVAVGRFTRTLGTLVSAGLGVITALRLTKGTLGNKAMEGAVETVIERVATGETIAEPMEEVGYFPPLLVQIVGVGERTGKLDEMLVSAAGVFEEKTEQSVKLFAAVLPPLIVMVLASVVGFVIISVLLPLLQLQEAIQ